MVAGLGANGRMAVVPDAADVALTAAQEIRAMV